jgi:hypothetical protein
MEYTVNTWNQIIWSLAKTVHSSVPFFVKDKTNDNIMKRQVFNTIKLFRFPHFFLRGPCTVCGLWINMLLTRSQWRLKNGGNYFCSLFFVFVFSSNSSFPYLFSLFIFCLPLLSVPFSFFSIFFPVIQNALCIWCAINYHEALRTLPYLHYASRRQQICTRVGWKVMHTCL